MDRRLALLGVLVARTAAAERYVVPDALDMERAANEAWAARVAPPEMPSPAPELSPTTTAVIAAGFAARSERQVASVVVAPWKLGELRALWGLQASVANDLASHVTTFGLAYRADWRWLFTRAFARHFDRAYAAADSERAALRRLATDVFGLLPVPSVGATVATFPADPMEHRHPMASANATLQLAWHVGSYVQLDVTAAVGVRRVDPRSELARTHAIAATATALVPQLLGLDRDDDRGLAVGAAFEVRDGRTYAGGVLDLRLTPAIAPRLTAGARDGAFEAGVAMAFAIGM